MTTATVPKKARRLGQARQGQFREPTEPFENPEIAMTGWQIITVPERLTEEDKSDWLDRFLVEFNTEYADMLRRLAD
ncbi:MAG: hypothetical protein ACYTKD_00735 [Planctomycetota bacterium]|jgi:hypothetical protein